MSFSLPPEVTFNKQLLDDGAIYQFRHQTLGLLGRIVLKDVPGGQCHISSEVAGDPDDPMTAKRLKVIQPLTEQITAILEARLGSQDPSTAVPPVMAPPSSATIDGEIIESRMIPCERCGAPAALLIFADTARTAGELEDYARKMYANYRQMNVPTWVIGAPLGIAGFETPSPILKVWPERQPVRKLTPNAFNRELDALLERHC